MLSNEINTASFHSDPIKLKKTHINGEKVLTRLAPDGINASPQ
jgi:hypothetical protein